MNIIRLILLALATCMVAVVLRQSGGIWDKLCIICCAVIIFSTSVLALSPFISFIEELQQKARISETFVNILFKTLAICILGEFAISVCKDQKYSTLAGALEFSCKVSIMVLALPIFQEIVKIFEDLLL